jgi:hypothetical protein
MDPVVPIEFHFHALMQEGQGGYSRLPCGWEQEGLVLSLVSDCLLMLCWSVFMQLSCLIMKFAI